MALSQSIVTGDCDSNGNPINATYWQWAQVNVQQIPIQTCQITLLGYASEAAYVANPAAPLSTLQFNYPCALTGNPTTDAILSQFPFSAAYIAANFSSYGVAASQAAAQKWVLAQSPMVGASVVS